MIHRLQIILYYAAWCWLVALFVQQLSGVADNHMASMPSSWAPRAFSMPVVIRP